MDWKKIGTYVGISAAIFVAGLLAGSQISCQSGGSNSRIPSSRAPKNLRVDTPRVARGISIHDTLTNETYRVDTAVLVDTVVLVDTLFIRQQASGSRSSAAPQSIESGIKELLPSLLLSLAGPIIAAFRPQTPRNFFEIYGHASHDLFSGTYGGGVECDLNLDQIHIANLTLYADLGYHRSLYADVGVRGKFYGFW